VILNVSVVVVCHCEKEGTPICKVFRHLLWNKVGSLRLSVLK